VPRRSGWRPCWRRSAWLLAAGTPVRAEVRVVDDSGATIRLAQPAKRIVSLAPHLTETLFAAGAGERIVGTVEYSEYPPAASRIARVGGYSRIDLDAWRRCGRT
jgi:iron complex transport system substrate-binding protein